jgi:hypothetical protein
MKKCLHERGRAGFPDRFSNKSLLIQSLSIGSLPFSARPVAPAAMRAVAIGILEHQEFASSSALRVDPGPGKAFDTDRAATAAWSEVSASPVSTFTGGGAFCRRPSAQQLGFSSHSDPPVVFHEITLR